MNNSSSMTNWSHLSNTACFLLCLGWSQAESAPPMKMLTAFAHSPESQSWYAQNDGVMGGVSSGQARVEAGELHFSGTLSLANNGGFAQIYSPMQRVDFSGCSGVRLRVKGDGRTYQFRLSTDASYRGSPIAYRADFQTVADQWIEVTLPFSSFAPGFRGRSLPGPPLNLTAIERMAFLLGDGRAGDFVLRVDWIGLQ